MNFRSFFHTHCPYQFILSVSLFAVVLLSGYAWAGCQMVYSTDFINKIERSFKQGFGERRVGNFSNKSDCESQLQAAAQNSGVPAHILGRCECTGASSSNNIMPSLPINTEAGAKATMMQMAGGLLGNIISNALTPTDTNTDHEVRQQDLQEREEKRRLSYSDWQSFQKSEHDRMLQARQDKDRKARNILARLELGGQEGAEKSKSSLKNGLLHNRITQSAAIGQYDTSAMSALDRLRCAAYFSEEAAKYSSQGDHERAVCFLRQADQVKQGQMIEIPCRYLAVKENPTATVKLIEHSENR